MINPLARELNLKIVYYGPGLSGKTTSLQHIHNRVRPESRGELLSLATEGDRTLYFDYLPVLLERVNDLPIRLQLYTVPGQVFYDATRKLLLNGADGVVFVADSQPAAADGNQISLTNLEDNLAELGIDLTVFPLVLQYNKRDLPNALPLDVLRSVLNPRGVPDFETVAFRGDGVFDAFKQIVRLAIDHLNQSQPSERRASATELTLEPDGLLVTPLSAAGAMIMDEPGVAGPGVAGASLSFATLSATFGPALRRIEHAIVAGKFGLAVSMAAATLSDLLGGLPPREASSAAKVTLLGLDGREYLRLARLLGQPDALIRERDALFGLYLAVAAVVKAEAL